MILDLKVEFEDERGIKYSYKFGESFLQEMKNNELIYKDTKLTHTEILRRKKLLIKYMKSMIKDSNE